MVFSSDTINQLKQDHPILENILQLEPVTWLNPHFCQLSAVTSTDLGIKDMQEAENLITRFAPFLKQTFPELKQSSGVIESPLRRINHLQAARKDATGEPISGTFYLKCDHQLPVAGSIKARGGFYEVLHYAEQLALKEGKITSDDDYSQFASPDMKQFFSHYTIGVASTGNLGLSIGIMSAELGFETDVFMSRDAKQWKKDLLREKGANVHEFDGDFSNAIPIGRETIRQRKNGYFVDDEDSQHLFLGYSTAAFYLQRQLNEAGITIDDDHPLFLYLPCGVGGSPGGIAFGMKQVFGDAVHCFFAEPTYIPSVLTGLVTGYMSDISVTDIGINHITEADGLAVARPSRFATEISDELISGIYTLSDDKLFELLVMLADTEHLHVEPSAAAGLQGPERIQQTDYARRHGINPENITHIAWSTGGALVPDSERASFYERGKALLDKQQR